MRLLRLLMLLPLLLLPLLLLLQSQSRLLHQERHLLKNNQQCMVRNVRGRRDKEALNDDSESCPPTVCTIRYESVGGNGGHRICLRVHKELRRSTRACM